MDAMIIGSIIGGILAVVAAVIGALVATERLIVTDLFRWRRVIPGGFVIIINGGSGVGKTTVAWALARRFNIAPVLGTDVVREVLRYTITADATNDIALLLTSSFLAHHRLTAELPDDTNDKVVDAFRVQSSQLVGPIVQIVNRVRTKRDPMIIEGVNVLATDVFDRIPNDPSNTLFFVNLYLDSTERHLTRLRERGERAREFPELTDRYVREIAAIRKIDSFLKEDTQRALLASPDAHISIVSTENSGSVSHSVNYIERAIQMKLRSMPRTKHTR